MVYSRFTPWEYHIKKYWDKDKAKMYLGEKYDQITPKMIEAEMRATCNALLAGVAKAKAEDGEVFRSALKESEPDIALAGRWLAALGYETVRPKAPEGPRAWESDRGDLLIMPTRLRIEVKRRTKFNFSSPVDYPYPDFMVVAKHKWDAANPKPLAFIIFSRNRLHAGTVISTSKRTWRVAKGMDRRYKTSREDYYIAPMDEVFFCPVDFSINPLSGAQGLQK